MRTSNNIAIYKDQKICILNGMHTGQLGVIAFQGPDGENIRVTDIERTLIDIVVRPGYAGGVFEVLNAYKLAKDKVSINRLAAKLKKLDYIYPYHQAIGFYLERAGYKKSSIELMQKFEIKYDFYLTHQMIYPDYSSKWQLFFPKDL
jgi:predicted transcriptional regulator of viral defense system